MRDHVLACQVMSCLCLSCTVEGGSRASCTRTRQVPLKEGVCIFAVAAVVHMFVLQQGTIGVHVCDGDGQG